MEDVLYLTLNRKNRKSMSKLPIIIGLAILVTLIGGYLLYMNQSSKTPKKTVETNTVVVTQIPTPTVQARVDKSKVRIQVVNGTGIVGQAGIVIKALTEAGYNADNIKSTNADKFDSTVFKITGRTHFDDTANDIATVLKPTFSDIAISTSKLDETSLFDIVVLTGKETSETPTTSPTGSIIPSASPTITPTITSSPSPTVSPTTAP